MDPDDIQLISFFKAQGLSEDDKETLLRIEDEQTNQLSLYERYRSWCDIIDR